MKLAVALAALALAAAATDCQLQVPPDGGRPPAPIVNTDSGIVETVLTDEQKICAAATIADEFFVPPGTPIQAIAQTIERVCGILPSLEQDLFGLINTFSAKREMLRKAHVMPKADASPIGPEPAKTGPALDAGSPDAAPPPKKR